MTLAVTWLDLYPGNLPTIWTAADTQISSGSETLTLEGSKVLELNIVCKDLSSPFQQPYFRTSIGFAYAGSTMTAFNTYATLSAIMGNLGGEPTYAEKPDYLSILQKSKDILKLYTTSKERLAEISLWGFCPLTSVPFIGVIRWDDGLNDYDITIHSGHSDLRWLILGEQNAKLKLDEMIRERIKKYHDISTSDHWRCPFYPLREIVRSKEFGGIGGNIQLALVYPSRFDHTYVLDPAKDGTKDWKAIYRNMDIYEDIGKSVGQCLIAINGMFMDFDSS